MSNEYAGMCSEGERCVCGGDTPRVRAGCSNWKKADPRKIAEALGFDPTNHHNAAKCPYCSPPASTSSGDGGGWVEHNGSKMAVALADYYECKLRNGERRPAGSVGSWTWGEAAEHRPEYDVIAYRYIGPALTANPTGEEG